MPVKRQVPGFHISSVSFYDLIKKKNNQQQQIPEAPRRLTALLHQAPYKHYRNTVSRTESL